MKLHLIKLQPGSKIKTMLFILAFSLLFSAPEIKPQKCVVNLLIAYTQEASDRAGGDANIVKAINNSVIQMNETFANSMVNSWVKLLRTVKLTDFTEEGCFVGDLTEFQFDDYVNLLRDKYHADAAAIILDNDQFCGLPVSDSTVATVSTAYCAVRYDCMVHNYSLAHMIGHLYGCGHDKFELAPNVGTAFKYGHGYHWEFNDEANFLTIMAMDDDQYCYGQEAYDCNIIPYWSNPEVQYIGVPTGTPEANNVRVINETASTLAAFKPIPLSYTIADSVNFSDIAIELSIDSLSTGSSYAAYGSSRVEFSAGQKIELNPGFTINEGCRFETVIDTTISNCSQ